MRKMLTNVFLKISLKHPNLVNREREFFYCALHDHPLFNAMSIFTFIVCLGITLLESMHELRTNLVEY